MSCASTSLSSRLRRFSGPNTKSCGETKMGRNSAQSLTSMAAPIGNLTAST